jgi:hypothetical protein
MGWTSEGVVNLAGLTLDDLQITLNAGLTVPGDLISGFKESVDNIVLSSTNTVPEPSSIALLAAGICGLGMLLRRRLHPGF